VKSSKKLEGRNIGAIFLPVIRKFIPSFAILDVEDTHVWAGCLYFALLVICDSHRRKYTIAQTAEHNFKTFGNLVTDG